jgi:hypothetical protein
MNHNIQTLMMDEFELKLDWLGFNVIAFNIVAPFSIATMNSMHHVQYCSTT